MKARARSWLADSSDSRPSVASTRSRRLPGCEMVRASPHDTSSRTDVLTAPLLSSSASAIRLGQRHHAALAMVAKNDCIIAVTASGASWVTR